MVSNESLPDDMWAAAELIWGRGDKQDRRRLPETKILDDAQVVGG
jgi:hypothetical protein